MIVTCLTRSSKITALQLQLPFQQNTAEDEDPTETKTAQAGSLLCIAQAFPPTLGKVTAQLYFAFLTLKEK